MTTPRTITRLGLRHPAVLAGTVLVFAVLIAAAAFAAGRIERGRYDDSLRRALRTAVAAAAEQTGDAQALVTSLARMPAVRQAAAAGDLAQIRRIAAAYPSVAVYADDAPPRAPATISRSAELRRDGRPLARIVATVPVAALPHSNRRLIAVSGGRVVAGDVAARARVPELPDGTATIEIRGRSYRVAASAAPLRGAPYRLVAVAPTSAVEAAVDRARRRTAFAAVALLATALAVLLAWPLLRRRRLSSGPRLVRAPAHRSDAALLVGSALGSTHDLAGLLQVVLRTALETTGAAGARLVEGERELARAGDPASRQPVEFPLGGSGASALSLLVYPGGRGLSQEAEEAARTLAAQAAIALENARLHLTVLEEASTDEVTGLRNRRRFRDALDAEVGRSERFGSGFALVVADIDDFKRVNDGFGHAAGDLVLRSFADIVRTHVRDVDLAARVGGDEFALLLPQTDAPSAAVAAERLCRSLAELDVSIPTGGSIRTTASFGVAAALPGEQGADVFRRADGALYEAKRRGKSQVAVANGDATVGAV